MKISDDMFASKALSLESALDIIEKVVKRAVLFSFYIRLER